MRTRGNSTPGQAMIEFVIAIMVVVVLIAGVVQFTELASLRGKLAAELRGEAGSRAMHPLGRMAGSPDYLRTWGEGDDAVRHTADDTREMASPATVPNAILDRTVSDPGDWQRLGNVASAELPGLRAASLPMSALGFLHAERRERVTLMPAMREWVRAPDEITVGAEIWLPSMQLEGFAP